MFRLVPSADLDQSRLVARALVPFRSQYRGIGNDDGELSLVHRGNVLEPGAASLPRLHELLGSIRRNEVEST